MSNVVLYDFKTLKYLLTTLEIKVITAEFMCGKHGLTKSSRRIAATALYPEDIVLWKYFTSKTIKFTVIMALLVVFLFGFVWI